MTQPTLTPRKNNIQASKREDEVSRRLQGQMVCCLGNLTHASVIERYFQERGWRVHIAKSSCEVRAMVQQHGASAALLSEEVPGEESAWLTCWKLLNASPQTRVVVLGSTHVERGERLAAQIGAAGYLSLAAPAAAILRAVQTSPPVAF